MCDVVSMRVTCACVWCACGVKVWEGLFHFPSVPLSVQRKQSVHSMIAL